MTLNEAAAALGVAPSTLRNQIRNGSMNAEKRGRDWWIVPKEVEKYRKEHRRAV